MVGVRINNDHAVVQGIREKEILYMQRGRKRMGGEFDDILFM